MQLVEQHIIDRKDSRFAAIDEAAFLAKNLYNAVNYAIRQEFISTGRYINYQSLVGTYLSQADYVAMPRKVSQQVMMQLDRNWRSFFAASKAYAINHAAFAAKPRLPGYKPKISGRNVLTYTMQAISRRGLRRRVIQPSGLNIEVQTKQTDICQVRIVPHKTHYTVEVVYEKQSQPALNLNPEWCAGVDIGLDNLATVTTNKPGFIPVVVNGRPIKSINRYYNKRRADLQSRLPVGQSSHRSDRLTDKRNRRIQYELHVASRQVIGHLVEHDIGTLIIGKNDGWKTKINLGRRTNQNFVSIPHACFIDMLTYKAELVGIVVKVTEESYTSKCSFLDSEPMKHHDKYAGVRRHRGLFISATARKIHADVNAAANIIRKVVPNAFTSEGIEGAVVHPVGLGPTKHALRLCHV